MAELTVEDQLKIISKAWGRQKGYCFFPHIDGKAETKTERIQSYKENRPFRWPEDRAEILEHMRKHQGDDLYWCPSLFEEPRRRLEVAMDEHCLWADLDEVDPRKIDSEYEPTIAWETSPGRYQALWLTQSDIQGSSWPGGENQRLTAYLGADPSGWDTTQLLRIPGWKNHKPEYRQGGSAPQGRLLWRGRRVYLVDEFNNLPEVMSSGPINTIVEDELATIDRHEVWGRVRLKVSKEVRELVGAREVQGDRSNKLWQIERDLADAGCTVPEIVAIVRSTVWNKYQGRQDELRRLTAEAAKAIAQRSDEKTEELEAEREVKPDPVRLFTLLRDVKPPKWLVKDMFTEGTCGFIAGEPKSYKSWLGLDLCLSIATGIPFLGHFDIINPGPVLYIQEEDSPPMVKRRVDKVWPGKLRDTMKISADSEVVWLPASEVNSDPNVDAYIGQGFILSDEGWQAWLDEKCEQGQYAAVILDPLMMISGDVEENRAQEMTLKIFRPLKLLARKYNTAMILVHHMKKGDPRAPQRGGQRMLGSVANHAWAEDSIYVKHGRGGDLVIEQESKSAAVGGFKITHVRNTSWEPEVIPGPKDDDEGSSTGEGAAAAPRSRSRRQGRSKVLDSLQALGEGTHSTKIIATHAGITPSGALRQLNRAQEQGKVQKVGQQWILTKN